MIEVTDVSPPRPHVLVVDDEPANIAMMSRWLTRAGYYVTPATNATTALAAVANRHVDIVLLDIVMPSPGGLGVLSEIRNQFPPTLLPVIMVTALDASDDVIESLELGANDYVTKPVDVPVLNARIRSQLRATSESRELARTRIRPGTVVGGRYRIVTEIGRGSRSVVFSATHIRLDRTVAVKVLDATLGWSSEGLERFRREAVLASRVEHRNVVSPFDFDVTPAGEAYLVMEFVDGESAAEHLRRNGPLPAARCASILEPVARALDRAHAIGVIHRDVKPSNILLSTDPGSEPVRLIDFGVASEGIEASTDAPRRLFGTPQYMAPEQLSGGAVDGRADVYGLGVTLYEMLTGRLPFDAVEGSPMAWALARVAESPQPLWDTTPPVPAALIDLVERSLAIDPEVRPTVTEFALTMTAAQ